MNNNIKSLGYALTFIPALYGCSNSTGKIKETTSLKRPNIILFVTDDHGMDALGCYGNNIIKTPNMDSLAANGVRFTQAYCTSASSAAVRSFLPENMGTLSEHTAIHTITIISVLLRMCVLFL